MPKAGNFLVDEGGVYLAFNSNDEVKKRKLKITLDPVSIYGLERTDEESELTGSETIVSLNTATAKALSGLLPSTGNVFCINDEAELYDALYKAVDGDTIIIENNMTVSQQIDIPAGVNLVGIGFQLGIATQIELKLSTYTGDDAIKLHAGSTLAGFSFIPVTSIPCVVGTYDANEEATITYCSFNGRYTDYESYAGTITLGVSNNVDNHLNITECTFTDCYTPIQQNGASFSGENLTWNSGAVFSAPSLPTLSFLNGIAGATPASNCDFITNDTVTADAVKSFCDTLSETCENMGFRIDGEVYTPSAS